MLFIILTLLGSITLAATAIFFSVMGLVQTFSTTALLWGTAIEIAKLLTASYLTRYWSTSGIITRVMGCAFVIILMLITSLGIYGHIVTSYHEDSLIIESLSLKHDDTLRVLGDYETRLDRISERISNRELSLSEVDDNIRNILGREDNYITARTRQADTARSDRDKISEELDSLYEEQERVRESYEKHKESASKQREEIIRAERDAGPIIAVMSILGDHTAKRAMLWFILMIVLVFDPVAVYLIVQVNRMFMIYKQDKHVHEPVEEKVEKEGKEDSTHLDEEFKRELKEKLEEKVTQEETVTSSPSSEVEANDTNIKILEILNNVADNVSDIENNHENLKNYLESSEKNNEINWHRLEEQLKKIEQRNKLKQEYHSK